MTNSSPAYSVGARVDTYDGPGELIRAELNSFYGADADGYGYTVRLDGSGRVATFDRSRLRSARCTCAFGACNAHVALVGTER